MHNDEFSARLSVNSILRLRAAAITALPDDSSSDSSVIYKVAKGVLSTRKCQENGKSHTSVIHTNAEIGEEGSYVHKRKNTKYATEGGMNTCMANTPDQCASSRTVVDITSEPRGFSQEGPDLDHVRTCSFDGAAMTYSNENINGYSDSSLLKDDLHEGNGSRPIFVESSDDLLMDQASVLVGNDTAQVEVAKETSEVFLPGLVIHMVPEESESATCWENWLRKDRSRRYRAFVVDRECFRDIVVSPFMFIDHLPWR